MTRSCTPLLLGIDWMDPEWLLDHFGGAFFWVALRRSSSSSAGCSSRSCRATRCCSPSACSSPATTARSRPASRSASSSPRAAAAAAFLGNVVGYEIGRAIGPPAHDQRDGRIIKREYFDQDPRVLREARRQGAGDRPVRADRADLHHRRRRRRPRWTAGTSSSGASSAPCSGSSASPCSATSSAGSTPQGQHRGRGPRDRRRLRPADARRVVAAPRSASASDGARVTPPGRETSAWRPVSPQRDSVPLLRWTRRTASSSALVSTGRTSRPTSSRGFRPRGRGRSRRRRRRPSPPPRAARGSRRAPRHRS